MKKKFTLFVIILMGNALFAAEAKHKSMLKVISTAKAEIFVEMDGTLFTPRTNAIIIQNVHPGYHHVKVYHKRAKGMYGRREDELLYNSSLIIKPGTALKISVDMFGGAVITEDRIMRGKQWSDGHVFYYNNVDCSNIGKWKEENNDNSYASVISDLEFGHVLYAMQKEWYEANKLKSALHIINMNFFTSGQIRDMMQLFSLENNKLEIAKQAYAKTIDKKNYRYIYAALGHRGSKEKLSRFIEDSDEW